MKRRAPSSSTPDLLGAESAAKPEQPHYIGHRDRLRERFLKNAEALPDYELLELVLFRSIPRKDVKPLAKKLVDRFGSYAAVLSAEPRQLAEIEGIGDNVAADLKLVAVAGQRIARSVIEKIPVMSSWSALVEYLRSAMAFSGREEFRVLFLNKRNQLIRDEVQARGTVDHTPAYPREVAKRALELDATALILAHNHPSGDPKPSGADIKMTREIVSVLAPLGIVVHDHVILGRDGHASLKALKHI